jgi:hypothetical protein
VSPASEQEIDVTDKGLSAWTCGFVLEGKCVSVWACVWD